MEGNPLRPRKVAGEARPRECGTFFFSWIGASFPPAPPENFLGNATRRRGRISEGRSVTSGQPLTPAAPPQIETELTQGKKNESSLDNNWNSPCFPTFLGTINRPEPPPFQKRMEREGPGTWQSFIMLHLIFTLRFFSLKFLTNRLRPSALGAFSPLRRHRPFGH